MFLSAVARSRWDYRRRQMFDGKLGIWPIVHQVSAKRNSKNRPAAILETKPLNVTKDVYEKFIIEKVVPVIKRKWPRKIQNKIYIQQDNAKPYSEISAKLVALAVAQDGWNIQIRDQPPNSPDMNVPDLVFFNVILSLQAQECTTNIDDLVEDVNEKFKSVSNTFLHGNFITLQTVMIEDFPTTESTISRFLISKRLQLGEKGKL